MRIAIQTIPAIEQRYETLGDYWMDGDGTMQIRVSDMGNEYYEFLCAIHEAIEFMLCRRCGISEPDIMAFDIAHPELHEPGEHPDAPYRKEHNFAQHIEYLIARQMNMDWQDYEAAAEATFK
jgi:hypothetical protein